jgi:hypothetical protein
MVVSILLNHPFISLEKRNRAVIMYLYGLIDKVSGPLSSIWKEWVKWCVDFGIEANAIIAVPYDWRLPPSMLEERDLYFHKLKFVILHSSCHRDTNSLTLTPIS